MSYHNDEPTFKKINNLHKSKYESRRSAPRTDVYGRKSTKHNLIEEQTMSKSQLRSRTPLKGPDEKYMINVSEMM